jgi:Protein of unknown function (DUF4230)
LFWGEQPPFMPFGRGGRYFFGLMDWPQNGLAPGKPRRRLGCPLAAALIILILALLAAFIFFRAETWPARTTQQSMAELERLGRDARNAFVRLAQLQPRVTFNNRVYLEQTTTIAELSVLARQVEVEHEMLHSWAGSTKRVKLHGTFSVKAGFDLRKKFTVQVSPTEVLIELPHAEILSVEQQQVEVLAFENGFWNRISPNDVENELATLPQLARQKSLALPAEAERIFRQQLLEKFHPAQPVRAIFPAPPPAG